MKLILLCLLSLSFVTLESLDSSEKTNKSIKKFLDKTYAFVPSGTAYLNKNKTSVQSFYISKTEITNREYREFLLDLKTNGDIEQIQICQIDSTKWNTKQGMNAKYVDYYHVHPAYANYPVVNISHEAAKMYCQWLNEKYNKQFGVKGEFNFRLMEKAEYVRAARGDSKSSYSWKSPFLRNSNGQILCNHVQLGAENIHCDQESGNYEVKIIPFEEMNITSYGDVLAPSKSYWPNEFGIYNMNGNAGEMISEFGIAMGGSWRDTGYDVRVESERTYDQANPTTGFRIVMTYVPVEK